MSNSNTSLIASIERVINVSHENVKRTFTQQALFEGSKTYSAYAMLAAGISIAYGAFYTLFGKGNKSMNNGQSLRDRDNRRGHIRDSARFRR